MTRFKAHNPINEGDLVKIRLALKCLYEFISPGITASVSEVQAIDGSNLKTYIEKHQQSPFLDELLAKRGLAVIAALSFLFYEKSLDLESIFVEKDFSVADDSAISRVVCCTPQFGLYELISQFHSENTLLMDSEDVSYFGDRRAVHHDGRELHFPVSQQLQFQTLAKNKLFNEQSFSVILSVMLMPLFVVYSIFLSFVGSPDIAAFIASFLSYQHMIFFNSFSKSEAFLTWYFSAPEMRIAECAPGKKHPQFLQKYIEIINETKAKITFILAKAKIENNLGILDDLIRISLENKKCHQAVGLDLHALLSAVRIFLSNFFDCNGGHFLEWFERSDALYKKINHILTVFKYMQVEIDTQRSGKLDIFIEALRVVLPSLCHAQPENEKTDFVEIEKSDLQEMLKEKPIEKFFSWLTELNGNDDLKNKAILLCHYHRVYDEFLKSKETSSRRFYAAASSYVSSFWSAAPAATPRTGSSDAHFSVIHFDEVENAITEAKTHIELQRAFVTLLATQGGEIEPIHKKFLIELVLQYQREHIATDIIFSDDLSIAEQSQKYANFSKLGADVIEAIAVGFIQKIRNSVLVGFGPENSLTVDSWNLLKAV